MQDRTATPRWMNVILAVGVLMAAATSVVVAANEPPTPPTLATNRVGENGTNVPTIHPVTFNRNVVWWPFASGPYYGDAANAYARGTDLVVTPVGSFHHGDGFNLPTPLVKGLEGLASGQKQYFLVQLKGEALSQPGWRDALLSSGAEWVMETPVNCVILRMDRGAYSLVSTSPDVAFIEPYHTAYRIAPSIGTTPQMTQELASSPLMNLELRLFPGEPTAPVVQALAQMSLNPTWVSAPEGGPGSAVIQLTQVPTESIVRLASIEAVQLVREYAPTLLMASRGSLYLQTNCKYPSCTPPTYPPTTDFTYWKVGLQGDGQIIQITDSGMSVNTGDKSDTRGSSGWTGIPNDNVLSDHRKVKAYRTVDAYGGVVGQGNLLGCDSSANGSFTHGQVTTGIALGGATRGFVLAPTNPKPTDDCPAPGGCTWNPNATWARDFGGSGFWFDYPPPDGLFKETVDTAFDGIAKGAKIVFVDGSATCPEAASPSIYPGNIQTTIQGTWLGYKASIHSYSFGSAAGTGGPTYIPDTDNAVNNYPINFVVWSAGNAGPINNGNGSNLAKGNVSNEAVCKNCVSAGASWQTQGSLVDYTSQGPGPSFRHVVTVLAEGYDQTCRRDKSTEDQLGAATCIPGGYWQGTSFAAPQLAGAAAVIREYFAEGFYPDGTNGNSGNSADKVKNISGALIRALMIAGTEPTPGIYGLLSFTPAHRFNHNWGWGQFFLSSVLPVAAYSEKAVEGLIVHDQPGDLDGDGTADGVTNLSLPATIGTTPASYSSEFQVLDTTQDLRVVLTWDDPNTSTGAVANDLDLEVRDCGANGTCGDSDDTIWYGDAFSEDYNEDGTLVIPGDDLNGDNKLTGYFYNLSTLDITSPIPATGGTGAHPGTPNNFRNHWDNMEGVFVATKTHAPDLNTDGTIDIRYLDSERGERGAGCTQAQPCPRTGKWQVTVTRVSGTSIVRPVVVIAGPVVGGASVRFDANPVSCNGAEDVLVSEVADVNDAACTIGTGNCPASVISGRTYVQVYDKTGALVDEERNLPFVNDPVGTLKFRLATPLAIQVGGRQLNNDGVLWANDGYTLKAFYDDRKGGPGAQNTKSSAALLDCQPAVDVFLIRQLGPDSPFLLAGGCDLDPYLDAGEQFSFQVQFFNTDPFQLVDAVATLEAFNTGTTTPSPYIAIDNPSNPVGTIDTEVLQRTAFGLRVVGTPPSRTPVDLRVCLKSAKAGQGVGGCVTFQMLMQADDEKHFYITDCPTGCTVSFDRNNDEKIENPITTNPFFDPLNHIHRNLYETVTYENMTAPSANTPGCPSGSCGNPGFDGPWDFDNGDKGFRTGRDAQSSKGSAQGSAPQPTNWGEDSNWNGVLDLALNEDANNDGTLEENWSNAGGCGWMTKGTQPAGGIWHTGAIGAWSSINMNQMCGGVSGPRADYNICKEYETELGSSGQNYWWQSLRSPTIHPVHFGQDVDGYAWKTRILDWAWNMQYDSADFYAHATWEFDLDTQSGEQTQLGDSYIQKNFGNRSGLITGGQLDLYGGGFAFAQTCRPKAGTDSCLTRDPSGNLVTVGYGDGRNGLIGGNRAGQRGCYFNDLNTIATGGSRTAAEYAVHSPLDADDDCDNNYSLGPDGCPGKCGVDDDGNGLIDDAGEICPCYKCSAGSPRAGLSCNNLPAFCNPAGGTNYTCDLAVDANGRPTPMPGSDDTCGDGSTDPYVASQFGGNSMTVRQRRNFDLGVANGVADVGRYSGDIYYNNLEDFWGPPGHDWATELGFIVQEPTTSTAAKFGYGVGVDDMVIEWQETHPVAQSGSACDTSKPLPQNNGECASIALGSTYNTGSGDQATPVTVVDPFPGTYNPPTSYGNLGECTVDGTAGVKVNASSGVELLGEDFCLKPTSPGATTFTGLVLSTTRVNRPNDGLVYVAYDGQRTPSVNVTYIDKDDGIPAHLYSKGPDGKPGIANFDDDGDATSGPTCPGGTLTNCSNAPVGGCIFSSGAGGPCCAGANVPGCDDNTEWCSTVTQFAKGRTPHRAGQPARWSDDTCGCPDNPVTATITNIYDTADVVVSDYSVRDYNVPGVGGSGDADGFLDRGEDVIVDVRVRNLANFALANVELGLSTASPLIQCMINDRIVIPRLEKHLDVNGGDEVDTASGSQHFRFVVSPTATRVNTADDLTSEFTVTLRGLAKASSDTTFKSDVQIEGTSIVQKFKLPHNLNAPSTTRATDFVDTFESYTNDAQALCTPINQQAKCTTAPYIKRSTGDNVANDGTQTNELVGTHCQVNNPANPYGNNTDPKDFCELGEGYLNSENHWHLHGPTPPSGTVCEDPSGCPDGGRSHGSGQKSLASGEIGPYGYPSDNLWTSMNNRMYWIKTRDNFQLGLGKTLNGNNPIRCTSAGCAGAPLDQAPVLEYWTQLSIIDYRLFGDDPPMAWDAALVYVCVDGDWDGTGTVHPNANCDTKEDGARPTDVNAYNKEHWEPLHAYYSPETSFRLNNFINCMYDPSDDGNTEDNFFPGSTSVGPSSTCYPNSSDTCVGQTENTPLPSSGFVWSLSYACWPETGQEGLEGENGAFGPGKWIKKLYNLKPYRGQKVLFRWHVSPGGLKGYSSPSDLGPGVGNRDDGWFIDDVRVYGRANSFALTADNTTRGSGVCPGSPVSNLIARVAAIPFPRNYDTGNPKPALACSDATVTSCDFNLDGTVDVTQTPTWATHTDAVSRPYILDGRYTSAGTCLGGALLYRFRVMDLNADPASAPGTAYTVVRDWLTNPETTVTPSDTYVYYMDVKCSSDTSPSPTISSAKIQFTTCVNPITLKVTAITGAGNLSWTGSGATWDVSRGLSIKALRNSGGSYAPWTCLAGEDAGSDMIASDNTLPALGDAIGYLVRVSNKQWDEGGTCGQPTLRPIAAGICPNP